jgi:RNA recognition motif-containing protein
MKIYVGNLLNEVNEEDLTVLFSQHGSVGSVKIVRDASNQISRGFGFVEMVRKVDGKKAIKTLSDFELKGQKLIVHEAKAERDRNSANSRKNQRGRKW